MNYLTVFRWNKYIQAPSICNTRDLSAHARGAVKSNNVGNHGIDRFSYTSKNKITETSKPQEIIKTLRNMPNNVDWLHVNFETDIYISVIKPVFFIVVNSWFAAWIPCLDFICLKYF